MPQENQQPRPDPDDGKHDGKITDLLPEDRVFLHREGKRHFVVRASDNRAAFLGFPNPVLVVKDSGTLWLWEAFLYQRGSLSKHSKLYAVRDMFNHPDCFTLSGSEPAALVAARPGVEMSEVQYNDHTQCLIAINKN